MRSCGARETCHLYRRHGRAEALSYWGIEMVNTHKKQHTIPKSYLAAWLEPNTPHGQDPAIFRISKDSKEVRRRSPANSFTETDRYTVRLQDGTRDLTVEHFLGGIENDFQGVLDTIRLRQPLTAPERALICAFTGAMLGRSKQQGDWLLKQELEHLEQIKDLERTHNIEPVASQAKEESIKNYHAQLVVNAIQIFTPVLFMMNLTICTTDDPLGFITSDAPAVMDNPKIQGMVFYGQPGLAQKDVEITLPLTPEHLALFTHKRGDALYVPLPIFLADEANRTTYFFCQSEFISHTGQMKDAWFEERTRHPV
jgi:Protein of unknown function (DUF4238)